MMEALDCRQSPDRGSDDLLNAPVTGVLAPLDGGIAVLIGGADVENRGESAVSPRSVPSDAVFKDAAREGRRRRSASDCRTGL